jgi:putative FmdB family regulatory protein
MPRYNYYCEECDDYFELSHSMTELVEDCIICESSKFVRVPSIPTYVQKEKAQPTEKQAGSLVEEYIKKNKKSVQHEKKRLKNQKYKG